MEAHACQASLPNKASGIFLLAENVNPSIDGVEQHQEDVANGTDNRPLELLGHKSSNPCYPASRPQVP